MLQTDIERKSVFMLMPCQTERPPTLWHHLLIMRQDHRNALGTDQTMRQTKAARDSGLEWVLGNRAACARGVLSERRVWMDLFVYWCLCFVFVSQQWPCLACLQTRSYTRCDKPAGKPMRAKCVPEREREREGGIKGGCPSEAEAHGPMNTCWLTNATLLQCI